MAPARRLRRGVVAGLVALVVAGVAVAALLVVRARTPERSVTALCGRLAEAQDLEQALATLDPATLAPQVRALDRAEAVAPDDVRAAVSTLAGFVAELAAEVEAAGATGAAATTDERTAALADALAARQDRVDAVAGAGTEVQQWAQVNCGLSLAGTAPTTTAPTTEAPAGAGASGGDEGSAGAGGAPPDGEDGAG